MERKKGGADTSQVHHVLPPPRTPSPRPLARPKRPIVSETSSAVILPKERPIASSSNPQTQNPFSPAKKTHPTSSINPFITPVKAKRTSSPDLSLTAQADPPQDAIVRARKRLRGESVSPSPMPRNKRRRSNGLDPPARDGLSQGRNVSPANDDADVDEDDSFVDDSPVKFTAGSKAFVPIFEEAKLQSQPTHSKSGNGTTRSGTLSRAKTLPSNFFGAIRKKKDEPDGATFHEGTPDLFGNDTAIKTSRTRKVKEDKSMDEALKVKKRKTLPGPKGLIPLKDDLFDGPPPGALISTTAETSRKRTLSNAAEHDTEESQDKRIASKEWDLLPPSPPPQPEDAERYHPKGKGKEKMRDGARHKKRRLASEDKEDEEMSSDDMEVKLVTWRSGPESPQAEGTDLTLAVDPELQQFHSPRRSTSPSLERFDVDLPEEMRRVLALSPYEVEKEREEEDIIKGVMRGRQRVGGEVWAPGEFGGELEADDWEGEGVPWQVAEL